MSKASLDIHAEAPRFHRQRNNSRTINTDQVEEAQVTFEKTIQGHYRHGSTGYRDVGVLLLTWQDDDMNCKETEVETLKTLFDSVFRFKVEPFEIPSEHWEISLLKCVTTFLCKYDSPDCLAIIYYGGHGYLGTETEQFKLAAKFQADANGDPTAFFGNLTSPLRVVQCDQLMILDCCHAAAAFAREHVGRRKFELLTSAAAHEKCDAPSQPGSFTKTLTRVLKDLLEKNPKGFSTSHLYRELYHTDRKPKPLLFDQARHDYGKIWLRPQVQDPVSERRSKEEGRFLNLSLRLCEEPEGAMMNKLALHLQYLPYVDEVRFKDLYAPKDQIAEFMLFVMQTQKLRPLIRKLHARRQLRKALEAVTHGRSQESHVSNLMKIHLEHRHQSIFDWSSASTTDVGTSVRRPQDWRVKSSTWPPVQADIPSRTRTLPNRVLSLEYKVGVSQSAKVGWIGHIKHHSIDLLWNIITWCSALCTALGTFLMELRDYYEG